ncbi:MAG TPA: serine/threonine-protein kinase [Polyangiales bacterium]|nr:serine/threonine-protein kinase [Polyangiales bacterium]
MTKTCRGCGREFSGSETYCPDDGLRLDSSDSLARRAARNADDTAAGSGNDSLVGVTLDGRYRILRVIGEGGMGVVYEALHVVIEKHVAVKVLRHTFTSRPDVVERFRQEAKSASRIGHPNIIDVSDFGETPSGASYIVMEMLTGEDLADILARERVLAPARAVRIVYQVARALDATHRKGIVHRDLKPENVYLIAVDGVSDVVKVVDFGVAKMSDLENVVGGRKLTRTGMLFGTPEYMSPEQAAGKPFDHRVDIYALGAIFFELLTGRVPFEGENFMEVLAKHGSEPVPALREVNPGTRVSRELEAVVMRALEKDPADRYQTMSDLANDLRLLPEMPGLSPGESTTLPEWALIAPGPPPSVDVTPSTAPVETRKARDLGRTPWLATRVDRRVVLWSGSAALVLAVFVAVLVTRSSSQVEATHPAAEVTATALPPAPSAEQVAPVPPPLPPPAAPPLQPSAAVPAGPLPEKIELVVRSEPPGARVNVFGKDVRKWCRETPCSVSIPRGQQVRLRATYDGAVIRKQLAYEQDAELELKFASEEDLAAAQASAKGGKGKTPASDLKVPDLFR